MIDRYRDARVTWSSVLFVSNRQKEFGNDRIEVIPCYHVHPNFIECPRKLRLLFLQPGHLLRERMDFNGYITLPAKNTLLRRGGQAEKLRQPRVRYWHRRQ